ncbi:MAG: hypothetical protein U9N14_07775, partial [Pseudomonadota bacterium]|nr:hypothetical protein [Pseudomonadota bacterium]
LALFFILAVRPASTQEPSLPTESGIPASLLFTPEQASILDRAVDMYPPGGKPASMTTMPDFHLPAELVPVSKVPKVLVLTGVLYVSADSWTIWLNGKKITPQNLPKEIHWIDVAQDRIQLKWLDRDTGKLHDVRLMNGDSYLIDNEQIVSGGARLRRFSP